jgi:RNA polymerase sigma-70 factor (ECF subfamily)
VSACQETPEQLLAAVAERRDRCAFVALFHRYAGKLKGFFVERGLAEPDAEELLQEVMLTLWFKADRFDPRRGCAGQWIFTIARNRHIDWLRARRPEMDPDDPALVGTPIVAPDDELEACCRAQRVRDALAALPGEQSCVLRRAYLERTPLPCIAEELNVPLGTVKSRLRLGLQRLERSLARSACSRPR